MEQYSYTSTHPLGHTGPVTGSLYLYLLCVCVCVYIYIYIYIYIYRHFTNVYSPPPQYATDLSPPDYFLFPKLKMKLKVLHFADVAKIQEAVTDELKKVQKGEIF